MDTITQEQIERIKREAIREFQSRGGKTKSNKKRVTALANLGKVDPAKRLAASNAAQAARRERERAERNQVVCPQCGEKVWDVAKVDQSLNKCWGCGQRWMNETEGEE